MFPEEVTPGLDKFHARCRQVRSGAQNHPDTPDFSGEDILPRKKQKTIRSTSFQSNRKNSEKVTVNS